MIKTYQRRPSITKAIQYTGDNAGEIKAFVGESNIIIDNITEQVQIKEEEFNVPLNKTDYVIQGKEFNFFVMSAELFEKDFIEVETSLN